MAGDFASGSLRMKEDSACSVAQTGSSGGDEDGGELPIETAARTGTIPPKCPEQRAFDQNRNHGRKL